MSHRASIGIIACFFILIWGCSHEKDNDEPIPYRFVSENIVGKGEYKLIYDSASDSIVSWIDNGMSFWKYEKPGVSLILDSILCFNRNKDKLVAALLTKTLNTNYFVDGVHFLYGTKIGGKWYFFTGPHIVIQREIYQKDTRTPLPFSKLHEIAVDNIFKGYLKKGKGGKWEINDAFFADFTSGAYGGSDPKTQAQWDSVYLRVVRNNWQVIDTTKNLPVQ